MRKILMMLGYSVCDRNTVRNKGLYAFDYILCAVYTGISFYNAWTGIDGLKLVDKVNHQLVLTSESLKTILLIILNIIVILRLNIRLYFKRKDKELSELEKLSNIQDGCVSIRIKALDRRMKLLKLCYGLDIFVLLFNVQYINKGIESSLALLVLVPIGVTFLNNMIDIASNKFQADEKVSYELSTMKGVSVHVRHD